MRGGNGGVTFIGHGSVVTGGTIGVVLLRLGGVVVCMACIGLGVMRLNPEKRVLVAGDTDVEYGLVVQAMAVLQKAGARKIGLMAEPPGQ